MARVFKSLLMVAVFVLAIYLVRQPLDNRKPVEEITYSKFWGAIDANRVDKGILKEDRFEGELTTGKRISVRIPRPPDPGRAELTNELLKHKVEFDNYRPMFSDFVQNVMFTVLPMVAFLIIFYMLVIRQTQMGGNQALSFGRSRALR